MIGLTASTQQTLQVDRVELVSLNERKDIVNEPQQVFKDLSPLIFIQGRMWFDAFVGDLCQELDDNVWLGLGNFQKEFGWLFLVAADTLALS